jgi:hypothetical protein
MTRLLPWRVGIVWLAIVVLLSTIASAQQKAQSVPQRNQGYDVSREVSLQGTVVSFAENSSIPPLGARLSIQTSSGVVDVHLGDARLLKASQFSVAAGDTIRIIGESLPYGDGTQFFGRIIQKGNQAVALRSARGLPLRPATKAGKTQAGVL